ncbi:carbon monoxide dehydrogenase [Clostridium taeniosporum]|uniref:Carbon monoxide dehydrogenase n=1 Tax=Clostridium taeniosporum TaxID=394958 RepID=A0A1D7XJ15_9CLOT|nr:carbon monoxide dehydrogenase [Clostridium taeniosporum]AOR23324.1 carbon monoxide dehydrogenase [Clostridium taeniosporum]
MKVINKKSKCNACHNIVKWNCIIYDEKSLEHIKREGMEAEEVIAISETVGNEGIITEYEAIVKCPFCNTKNKFLI